MMDDDFLHPIWKIVGLYQKESSNRNCDNYHLFNAAFFNCLSLRNIEATQQERYAYAYFLSRCCDTESGIFNRYPDYKDQTSHDEYIGIAYISWAMETKIASHIVEYGKKHLWFFNNKDQTKRDGQSFLGRMPGFITFMKACARQWTNPIENLIWFLTAVVSPWTDKQNTSGKCMIYLECRVMAEHRSILCWLGTKLFLWQMSKKYPGGPKEMYRIYFPMGHPVTFYAKENWSLDYQAIR